MTLFRFPMDHPVSALAFFSALLLFGLISLPLLPFEELPELDIPEYRILSAMPGFPPAEMENLVTIPLENALSGVQGIRECETFTGTGITLLVLRLDWGEEPERTARELRECIDDQYPLLPRECAKPILLTRSTARSPFMTLALEPKPGVDAERFHRIIQHEFREELQKLEEISLAEFRGLRESQITVEADTDLLSSLGVPLTKLAEAVEDSLVSSNAGKLSIDGREQLIRLDHPYRSAEDLRRLRPFEGIALSLGELAVIRKEFKERSSLYLLNGHEAVGLRLYKNGKSGTLRASRMLRKRLPRLKETFASELSITLLRDSAEPIRRSRRALIAALIFGLGGVLLVLILLYRDPVIPLITSLAVPATLLPVFFILYLTDRGLNSLSLTGMIVGTGLIADADIVVLEHLQSGASDSSAVFPALLSSTMTTILVFLPPLCLPGAPGVLFRDLIITIFLTVSLSLPVAFLLTPALWSLFRRRESPANRAATMHKSVPARPAGLLNKALRRPRLSVLPAVLLSLGGMSAAFFMPLELLPPDADSPLIIRADFPGDLGADEILKRSEDLCKALLDGTPCRRLCLESGHDESNLRDRGDPESAIHRLRLELSPLSETQVIQIRGVLDSIPGLSRIRITTESSSFASLLSPDRDSLFLTARSREELDEFSPPSGLELEFEACSPRLLFLEDRDSMDAAGIDRGEMIRELQILLTGTPAGEIPAEDAPLTVVVRGEEELRSDRTALSRILISSKETGVSLGSLGQFRLIREKSLLTRRNRRPCLRLLNSGSGTHSWPFLEQRASAAEDAAALPELILLSLLLLYLILGMQSGSFADALILMICPPLAMGGALLSLWLFTPSLSLYAFMGLLILQGTAVNSGILLVDSFKTETPVRDHLQKAAIKRLRPVLATTLTTAAALLPVILMGVIREDRQADTAIAVTGGLLTAVPLIMILLPPLYGKIHGFKDEPCQSKA